MIEERVEIHKNGKKSEKSDILDIYVGLHLSGFCPIDEIVCQSINFFFVG